MKWNPIKTCPPPKDEEILVSDGVYVHEAVRYEHGWTNPETQTGWESEFYLSRNPLYWAKKPNAPKVRLEDIPDPVKPKKAARRKTPKKGGIDNCLQKEAASIEKAYLKKLSTRSNSWFRILEGDEFPEGMGKV